MVLHLSGMWELRTSLHCQLPVLLLEPKSVNTSIYLSPHMFEKEDDPDPSHVFLSASGCVFIADWVSRGRTAWPLCPGSCCKAAVSVWLAASVTLVALSGLYRQHLPVPHPRARKHLSRSQWALPYAKASKEIFSCLEWHVIFFFELFQKNMKMWSTTLTSWTKVRWLPVALLIVLWVCLFQHVWRFELHIRGRQLDKHTVSLSIWLIRQSH